VRRDLAVTGPLELPPEAMRRLGYRVIDRIVEHWGPWFHVDGAYGAAAVLTPAGGSVLAGMERADSLVIRSPQVAAPALRGGRRARPRAGRCWSARSR
jgi:hypothetical protein